MTKDLLSTQVHFWKWKIHAYYSDAIENYTQNFRPQKSEYLEKTAIWASNTTLKNKEIGPSEVHDSTVLNNINILTKYLWLKSCSGVLFPFSKSTCINGSNL